MSTTVNETASAATSGASATQRFHADESPYAKVLDVPCDPKSHSDGTATVAYGFVLDPEKG